MMPVKSFPMTELPVPTRPAVPTPPPVSERYEATLERAIAETMRLAAERLRAADAARPRTLPC
jgi:hypothetical protein